MNSNTLKILCFAFLMLPAGAYASEVANLLSPAKPLNITDHFVGYLAIGVTVLAYIAAMSEEALSLRKSKPMVMGSAIIWFAICIYYSLH